VFLVASAGKAQEAAAPPAVPSVIIGGSGDVEVAGQGAARKGDATDAGQPIVEGSKNVFINGRPAALAGDKTNCGGVIVGGAPTVFVNGKPLARSGDLTAGCEKK
jgi:uncharacterized Zn-binding protein involved in type VI secretion